MNCEVTIRNLTEDKTIEIPMNNFFSVFEGAGSIAIEPGASYTAKVLCEYDMDCYQKFRTFFVNHELVYDMDVIVELKSI